jgi:hypothetical protein
MWNPCICYDGSEHQTFYSSFRIYGWGAL